MAGALAAGQDLQLIILTPSDLSLTPQRFAGSGPSGAMGIGFNWGTMQDNPMSPHASPPIRHFREFTAAASPNGVFAKMADDVRGEEVALHCGQFTDGPSPAPYTTVQGDPTGLTKDPVTYQVSLPGPMGFQYNWSTKHTKIVEANLLDVTLDHLPFALCVNPASVAGPNAFPISPWFVQFGVAHGTYLGRPVRYLGGTERLFAGGVQQAFGDTSQFFVGSYFIGEHPDRSHECAFVMVLFKDNGAGQPVATNSMAFYVKEITPHAVPQSHHRHHRGHAHHRAHKPHSGSEHTADPSLVAWPGEHGLEVVTSRQVHGEIWFKRLNWSDSPVASKAIYRFADKEIHFDPKWGFSGYDTCSRVTAMASPGDSYGPWCEIHSRNDFELNLNYHECTCSSSQISYEKPLVF